ncbi:MAG: PAS domain S-box protein [Planctomycetes bacterium]|nr:PAS domain S-box protein [Planctomycetota bacterium]
MNRGEFPAPPEEASLPCDGPSSLREARLRAVFGSLTTGVLILDPRGRIVDCNAGAERILALTRGQILDHTQRDPRWRLTREDGTPFATEEYLGAETLRTGESREGVVVGIHGADGSLRWCSVNSQLLRDEEGRPAHGVVISFDDITALRRMTERLLEAQKLESVARLAGGIAHEFNNLLTAVLGYSELGLAQVAPGTKLSTYLTQILHSGEQAAHLTEQLLAFARRREPLQAHVDLGELCASSLDIVRALVGERVSVELQRAPGLWPVIADRVQMQQVLLNLASNAADALVLGGHLTIRCSNLSLGPGSGPREHGDWVEWVVEDDGVGMAPEVQAHLFEPFFTSKQVGEGRGLGLSTCHGIVHRHGGAIAVRSALGAGSSFTIRLPRARDERGD